jgi:hypothetical protein
MTNRTWNNHYPFTERPIGAPIKNNSMYTLQKKITINDYYPESRICTRYKAGFCARGYTCNFSHSQKSDFHQYKQINSNLPNTPKDPCKFYLRKSGCSSGNMCKFQHINCIVECFSIRDNGYCPKGVNCEFVNSHPVDTRTKSNCHCVINKGYCSKGDTCLYYHPPNTPTKPLCIHYPNCRNGNTCNYRHEIIPSNTEIIDDNTLSDVNTSEDSDASKDSETSDTSETSEISDLSETLEECEALNANSDVKFEDNSINHYLPEINFVRISTPDEFEFPTLWQLDNVEYSIRQIPVFV